MPNNRLSELLQGPVGGVVGVVPVGILIIVPRRYVRRSGQQLRDGLGGAFHTVSEDHQPTRTCTNPSSLVTPSC